jgi:hypothetical protein
VRGLRVGRRGPAWRGAGGSSECAGRSGTRPPAVRPIGVWANGAGCTASQMLYDVDCHLVAGIEAERPLLCDGNRHDKVCDWSWV